MGAPRSHAHRILFGLQPDVGVTVTRSSLSDEPSRTWLRRLEVHVRLQRFESTPPPPGALSSFEFTDGLTAVVRRWNVGGTLGRNDALALVAPTELLTPTVALGLDTAFGWETATEEPTFKPWDAADLVSLAEGETDALRTRAKARPEVLRRSLAQLFDARDRPLTVVGCDDEHRVPLVWALHRLGARYLRQTYALRRAWTFSTYEVEHSDAIPNQPAVVFLPERPAGPATSRRIVDVRVEQPASEEAGWAAQFWIDGFLDDYDLDDEFAKPPVPAVAGVRRRSAGDSSTQRVEPERSRVDVGSARSTLLPAGADRGGEEDDLTARPARPDERAPTWASSAVVASDLRGALDAMTAAATAVQFAYRFDVLRQSVTSPQRRADLRTTLTPTGYAQMDGLIVRFAPTETHATERFRQLRASVYGPDREDLREGSVLAFAMAVLASGVPDADARGLVEEIDGLHGSRVLDATLADLWRVDHDLAPAGASPPEAAGHEAPDPGEGVLGRLRTSVPGWAPFGRPGQNETGGGARRRPSTVAAVGGGVAVVAFLVLVGLGLVALVTSTAGESDGGAPPSSTAASTAVPVAPTPGTAPSTASSSVALTPPASVGGSSVSGTVVDRTLVVRVPRSPADGDDVALVLRPAADDTYIYQAPCDAEGDEWVCSKLGVALPAAPNGYEVVVVRAPRINTGQSVTLPRGAATVDTIRDADLLYRGAVAS